MSILGHIEGGGVGHTCDLSALGQITLQCALKLDLHSSQDAHTHAYLTPNPHDA